MKLQVTRVEIVEIDEEDHPEFDLDAFHDSLVDDVLDGQDSGHETSDAKYEYVPRILVEVKVERVKEDVE